MLRIEGTDYEDLHPKKLCLILTEVNKDSRKVIICALLALYSVTCN